MARKVAVALFLLALVAVGQSVSVSGRLSAFGEKKGIISSIKKGVIKGISGSLKTFAQGKALDVPAPIEKYLIECFPSAAPGAKCPAANQLTALAGKLTGVVLEQVKTLFKTATDAVDPKTSAENEVLSDEQEGASSRFMDLELPRFAAGMRWPKTGPGSLTQIAYCWENGVTWWNKIFFLWAMRIVRASSTNLRFEKVDCGAAGHKIKLGNNNGRCGTQAGGYRGAGNPTAGTPGAAGKPSTDQFIRCDFTAFNRYSGAHEFFHALGFGHTQCRSDRDHYLVVAKNAGHQWRIIGNNEGTFDFDSVMLYPPSARGKPKTKPKAGYKGTPKNMGQRSKLSAEDVRILNHVYA